MNVEPETLRLIDLTLELAEAMSGEDYDRWDQLVRTLPDLIHVAQAASTMLGRMIRDEGAREGIANGEVWVNVRRVLLLQAG